jgi:hypothetical protein
MIVGGSLILEATVNNTVDLDASGASLDLEINSMSSAVARIGANARVEAGNLTVSALTNTDFSIDITDAAGGSSSDMGGPGGDVGFSGTRLLTPERTSSSRIGRKKPRT